MKKRAQKNGVNLHFHSKQKKNHFQFNIQWQRSFLISNKWFDIWYSTAHSDHYLVNRNRTTTNSLDVHLSQWFFHWNHHCRPSTGMAIFRMRLHVLKNPTKAYYIYEYRKQHKEVTRCASFIFIIIQICNMLSRCAIHPAGPDYQSQWTKQNCFSRFLC